MLILIADDDKLARYTIKSMLRDLDDGAFLICEATNGKTLVEQCRRLQPDVAFVDISMPQMDGLTAIEQCRACAPDTQFVVVTGHSDFAYAQRSITLQVADYIVKPIEPVQLKKLMHDLAQRLARKQKNLNMDFQVKVSQNYQLWEEIGYCEAEDPCAGQSGSYFSFTFFIDTPPDGAGYRAAYLSLIEELNALGRDCLGRRIRFILRDSKEASLTFIVRCEESEFPPLKKQAERLCRTAGNSIAVSCLWAQGLDLWQLFKNSGAAAEQDYLRFGIGVGCVFSLNELPFSNEERELLSAMGDLVGAFQEADETHYIKALSRLRAVSPDMVVTLDTRRLTELLSLCLNGRFSWDGLPRLFRQLTVHKERIYAGAGLERSDKVTRAMEYMEKHYMHDISVVQLSEKLEMTPNYFSKLFRERTGRTFSAYLTALRINQAKRILLTRQDVLVKDIALMVGYFSSRHFSNVFKKITGFYPSEFRDKSLSNI